jgi:hypothetical protein
MRHGLLAASLMSGLGSMLVSGCTNGSRCDAQRPCNVGDVCVDGLCQPAEPPAPEPQCPPDSAADEEGNCICSTGFVADGDSCRATCAVEADLVTVDSCIYFMDECLGATTATDGTVLRGICSRRCEDNSSIADVRLNGDCPQGLECRDGGSFDEPTCQGVGLTSCTTDADCSGRQIVVGRFE